MQKRTLKVALLAVLSVVLVLGMSTVALADQTWSDLPDTVTAKYGITDNQVAAISDGYAGGLWKPFQSVSRAQFTKMAVAAFNIPLADPATASFTDVPKGSYYYKYIEGAKAAAVANGVTATSFGPNALITRQQALAIVARYVASANGYDLATMYSAAEVAALLAHFGDAASISAELAPAMAFAYDFGLTVGNDYGNLDPLANLTRIQGAAMLIRAQAKVPPAMWTAAKLEMVSADKSENLIGQPRSLTFEVTDAAGHPAIGVLVDFDVLIGGDYYVGNISPQAAVTNNYGQVTVNLLSAELGVQRVSATVAGVGTVYSTNYWLALDEVYILDRDLEAENNAGEAHDWTARVVVFGPGPRSTSALDWYNAIDASYDPANVNVGDGVDVICVAFAGESITDDGDWGYADELDLAKIGLYPRTLAGVDVWWKIVNVVDDNPSTTTKDETVPSVGDIVEVDGVAMAAAKSAKGVTDANGLSSISIMSEATGQTKVTAAADYVGNPYPQQLFNHDTGGNDYERHYYDWDDQPVAGKSIALKTWIPHVIGGDTDGPITPASAVNNTGEVEEFVLELKDVFGNPIKDYTVIWWIQGVGFFKSDDSSWSGVGETNKDWDLTDAAGKSSVWVKSLVPGQTIVHCKVMDKYGLPYKEWNVTKQWYSIDDVSFLKWDVLHEEWVDDNVADNDVNDPHTFNVLVSGAKYVHVLYDINRNGLLDDQALLGYRDDLKAASGFVAAMQNNQLVWLPKAANVDLLPGQVFSKSNNYVGPYYIRYAHTTLDGAEFWWDSQDDGIDEVWSGLKGKKVYFYTNVGRGSTPVSDVALPPVSGQGFPYYVGSITSTTPVVTDDDGFAAVTVNSLNKGTQYVYAVADYLDNPQDGDPLKPTKWAELRWDSVVKTWEAAGGESIKIFAQGAGVVGDRWVNPVLPWEEPVNGGTATNPNVETIAVQVYDVYGNALEGYKVTWEIVGQGSTTAGTIPTYHPFAHFEDAMHDGQLTGEYAGIGDLNPFWNSNMLWGDFADGVHPDYAHDANDDDYAWGWTENHEINFKLSLASAANVTLVLDETAGQLDARTETHFTNIVNIKVYRPTTTGYVFWKQYEVTKVWSLEAPALTSGSILVGQTSTGPWVTSLTSAVSQLYANVAFADQYSNPITGTYRIKITGPFADTYQGIAATEGVNALPIFTAAGLHTLWLYNDANDNGNLDVGEVVSAPVTITVP